MSEDRDELYQHVYDAFDALDDPSEDRDTPAIITDAIITAGYRKVFDGDCGLSNVKDPDYREAAEAWMRWANLAMNDEIGAIGAMKQMLTEFGYRKAKELA